MSSGNLDALSAIATVLNPNDEEFQEATIGQETILVSTHQAIVLEVPYEVDQETLNDDTGQNIEEVEGEGETFCDLDESTKEAGQQLQPRIIKDELKNAWQDELNASGVVVCTVPGCQMKYSTLFSFERHYKWCTGEKGEGVETCEYCTSQFLSTNQGIEDHVRKEHPSEINDYCAKRLSRKIIKECREKEQRAREEKEAKALELKRDRQNSRGTYSRKQTCYTKRPTTVKSDSENSKDGSDKKVRFKNSVAVINMDKDENEEADVDDPLQDKTHDKPKRQPIKSKESAEVIQLARNWGVQRKTYSRSGGTSESSNAKDTPESECLVESESLLENVASESASETKIQESETEAKVIETVTESISEPAIETMVVQTETLNIEESVVEEKLKQVMEKTDQDLILPSSEVPMEVDQEEVVTFFNPEEQVMIPIETEGCVTVGNEIQEDENYQLVIVTGESGESQYIVIDDSMSQALVEGVALAETDELPVSENSSFNIVTIPDEELAISSARAFNETVEVANEEIVGVAEAEQENQLESQVLEEVVVESIEDLVPEDSSSKNESSSTNENDVENIDNKIDNLSVEDARKDLQREETDILSAMPSATKWVESNRKAVESKRIIIRKRKVKTPQMGSDSEDSKDPNVDRFQLAAPKNLSSINIGDDFLPPNLNKLLEFGSGKSDKLPKKSEMLLPVASDQESEKVNGSWVDSPKHSGSPKHKNSTTVSSTVNSFSSLLCKEKTLDSPSRATSSPIPTVQKIVSENSQSPRPNQEMNASSSSMAKAYASPMREESLDTRLITDSQSSSKSECRTASPSVKAQPSKDINLSAFQSIAGFGGNHQKIKIYTPNSDGTLAPLEDFSILSSNPQIRIMTPERDGTLKPMVISADKNLILKSVQKMIATGASSGTLKTHDNKISILPEPSVKNKGQVQEIDIENDNASSFDPNYEVSQSAMEKELTIEPIQGDSNLTPATTIALNSYVNEEVVEKKASLEAPVSELAQICAEIAAGENAITSTPVEVPLKRKRGRPPLNQSKRDSTSLVTQRVMYRNSKEDSAPPTKAGRLKLNQSKSLSISHSTIDDSCLQLDSTMDESLSNDFGSLKNNLAVATKSTPMSYGSDSCSDSDSNSIPLRRKGPAMRGGRYTRRRRGGRRGAWSRGRRLLDENLLDMMPLSFDNIIDPKNRMMMTDTATFQCSACKLIFDIKQNAKNHITSKHNGLARINDDTPLDESETMFCLRHILKLKKSLKCLNEVCEKHFRSAPGYYNHSKMCGVEVNSDNFSSGKEYVSDDEYIEQFSDDLCSSEEVIDSFSAKKPHSHDSYDSLDNTEVNADDFNISSDKETDDINVPDTVVAMEVEISEPNLDTIVIPVDRDWPQSCIVGEQFIFDEPQSFIVGAFSEVCTTSDNVKLVENEEPEVTHLNLNSSPTSDQPSLLKILAARALARSKLSDKIKNKKPSNKQKIKPENVSPSEISIQTSKSKSEAISSPFSELSITSNVTDNSCNLEDSDHSLSIENSSLVAGSQTPENAIFEHYGISIESVIKDSQNTSDKSIEIDEQASNYLISIDSVITNSQPNIDNSDDTFKIHSINLESIIDDEIIIKPTSPEKEKDESKELTSPEKEKNGSKKLTSPQKEKNKSKKLTSPEKEKNGSKKITSPEMEKDISNEPVLSMRKASVSVICVENRSNLPDRERQFNNLLNDVEVLKDSRSKSDLATLRLKNTLEKLVSKSVNKPSKVSKITSEKKEVNSSVIPKGKASRAITKKKNNLKSYRLKALSRSLPMTNLEKLKSDLLSSSVKPTRASIRNIPTSHHGTPTKSSRAAVSKLITIKGAQNANKIGVKKPRKENLDQSETSSGLIEVGRLRSSLPLIRSITKTLSPKTNPAKSISSSVVKSKLPTKKSKSSSSTPLSKSELVVKGKVSSTNIRDVKSKFKYRPSSIRIKASLTTSKAKLLVSAARSKVLTRSKVSSGKSETSTSRAKNKPSNKSSFTLKVIAKSKRPNNNNIKSQRSSKIKNNSRNNLKSKQHSQPVRRSTSTIVKNVDDIPKLTRSTTYVQNLESNSRSVRRSTQLSTKCSSIEAAQRSLSKPNIKNVRSSNQKSTSDRKANYSKYSPSKTAVTNSKENSNAGKRRLRSMSANKSDNVSAVNSFTLKSIKRKPAKASNTNKTQSTKVTRFLRNNSKIESQTSEFDLQKMKMSAGKQSNRRSQKKSYISDTSRMFPIRRTSRDSNKRSQPECSVAEFSGMFPPRRISRDSNKGSQQKLSVTESSGLFAVRRSSRDSYKISQPECSVAESSGKFPPRRASRDSNKGSQQKRSVTESSRMFVVRRRSQDSYKRPQPECAVAESKGTFPPRRTSQDSNKGSQPKRSVTESSGMCFVRKTSRVRRLKVFFDELMSISDLEHKSFTTKSGHETCSKIIRKSNTRPYPSEKFKIKQRKIGKASFKSARKLSLGRVTKAKIKLQAKKNNKEKIGLAIRKKYTNIKSNNCRKAKQPVVSPQFLSSKSTTRNNIQSLSNQKLSRSKLVKRPPLTKRVPKVSMKKLDFCQMIALGLREESSSSTCLKKPSRSKSTVIANSIKSSALIEEETSHVSKVSEDGLPKPILTLQSRVRCDETEKSKTEESNPQNQSGSSQSSPTSSTPHITVQLPDNTSKDEKLTQTIKEKIGSILKFDNDSLIMPKEKGGESLKESPSQAVENERVLSILRNQESGEAEISYDKSPSLPTKSDLILMCSSKINSKIKIRDEQLTKLEGDDPQIQSSSGEILQIIKQSEDITNVNKHSPAKKSTSPPISSSSVSLGNNSSLLVIQSSSSGVIPQNFKQSTTSKMSSENITNVNKHSPAKKSPNSQIISSSVSLGNKSSLVVDVKPFIQNFETNLQISPINLTSEIASQHPNCSSTSPNTLSKPVVIKNTKNIIKPSRDSPEAKIALLQLKQMGSDLLPKYSYKAQSQDDPVASYESVMGPSHSGETDQQSLQSDVKCLYETVSVKREVESQSCVRSKRVKRSTSVSGTSKLIGSLVNTRCKRVLNAQRSKFSVFKKSRDKFPTDKSLKHLSAFTKH